MEIAHGMDVPEGTDMPEGFELGDGVRRDSRCVENWPEADSVDYDPRCCRFPKSCSATSVRNRVYRKGILEPVPEDQERLLPPIVPSALCMLMFVEGVAYVAPVGSSAYDESAWVRVKSLDAAADLLRVVQP